MTTFQATKHAVARRLWIDGPMTLYYLMREMPTYNSGMVMSAAEAMTRDGWLTEIDSQYDLAGLTDEDKELRFIEQLEETAIRDHLASPMENRPVVYDEPIERRRVVNCGMCGSPVTAYSPDDADFYGGCTTKLCSYPEETWQ